jgi:hypothetical protein
MCGGDDGVPTVLALEINELGLVHPLVVLNSGWICDI